MAVKPWSLGRLQMVGGGETLAGVCRVALHDGAVRQLNEILYERGLQEVVAAGFAGGDLDCYLAFGLASESLVELDDCLGRNLAGHVDHGAVC